MSSETQFARLDEAGIDTSRAVGARTIASLVGGTPLIRLNRSGEERVLVKHEGYGPSGSFFDRVASRALDGTSGPLVVAGGDAFALAAAVAAVPRRQSLTVVVEGTSWRRLARLLSAHGARIEVVDEGEVPDAVAAHVARGATRIERTSRRAVVASLSEVAAEVAQVDVTPSVWVLPDYGVDPPTLQAALSVGAGAPYLELIADDRERRRTLAGPDACRRVQVGHREGFLLSPIGAEIVEAAVNAAHEVEGVVVALVPEDGRRYLGWW